MSDTVVDFFSNIAEDFASAYQDDPDFRERFSLWQGVLNECAKSAKTAIDMGCGPGFYSFYLASLGLSVTGVDAADGMIALCEQRKQSNQIQNCNFLKAIVPDMPKNLGSADLIISSSLLEYAPDLKAALLSFREHLNDDGRIVFSIPNRKSLYRKLERIRFRLTGKPKYYRFVKNVLSEGECVQMMKDLGFHCERVAYYGHANLVSKIARLVLPMERTENLFLAVFRKV